MIPERNMTGSRIGGPAAPPLSRSMPLFLFGCSRSGTSLAQSLIGSHPQILTFPETNFIAHAFGDHAQRMFFGKLPLWKRHLVSVRLAACRSTRSANLRMRETLEALGEPESRNPVPGGFPNLDDAIRRWAGVLGDIATERGYSRWLEKTPSHLGYIEDIQRLLPDARFLHIMREPQATIASLVDAGRRYRSWARFADVRHSLAVWNHHVALSQRHAGDPRHFLFRYESLVSRPEEISGRIFAFAGLEPVPLHVLHDRRLSTARRSIHAHEHWKRKVFETIINHDKSRELLSSAELAFIAENASPIPSEAL